MKSIAIGLLVVFVALATGRVTVDTDCVYFASDIQFTAEYETNKTENAISEPFMYDNTSAFMVSCNASEPANGSLTITVTTTYTALTLEFTLNEDDNTTMLESVGLVYWTNDTKTFPNATSMEEASASDNVTDFSMGPLSLFMCNSSIVLELESGVNLTLANIQAQIFNYNGNGTMSDMRTSCSEDAMLPFVAGPADHPCLVMTNFTGEFLISYKGKDGKMANATLALPSHAADTYHEGKCDSKTNMLSISWSTMPQASVDMRTNQLMLTFTMGANGLTYLSEAMLMWEYGDTDLFKKAPAHTGAGSAQVTKVELLATTKEYYYSCAEAQMVAFPAKDNDTKVDLTLDTIVYDVFRSTPGTDLTGLKYDCEPTPSDNKYTVNTTDGQVCLLLEMEATFKINYNDTKGQLTTATLALPAQSSIKMTGGSCSNDTDMLVLVYSTETFTFAFTQADSMFRLSNVTMLVSMEDPVVFPNSPNNTLDLQLVAPDSTLVASTDAYYKCDSSQDIALSKDVTLTVSKVKVQAFRMTNTTTFGGTETECDKDKDATIDNTVPIVVGACLGGLVLLVIIAYLIGRRKSKRGYQQV